MSVTVKTKNLFPTALATVDASRDRAVGKATTAMRGSSQREVPVDTGTLRASAETEIVRGAGTTSGEVSYNTGYAIYVEMGTSKMPAQPYLIPGYQTGKKVLISSLVAWLRSL